MVELIPTRIYGGQQFRWVQKPSEINTEGNDTQDN